MLDEIREKIGEEIEQLVNELNVLLPQRIEKAVELGDLRESAEYKSVHEVARHDGELGHFVYRQVVDLDTRPEADPIDGHGIDIDLRQL